MNDIKKLVKKIIRKYGTNDPYTLCDLLGILVRHTDLGNVRGMYQHELRQKIIHLNTELEAHVQRQVLAHELGHALLHRKINTVFLDTYTYLATDKIEIEANMFAAELLIDDSAIVQYGEYSQECLAYIFGVQERLVEYKIKNLI